jgi:hypothetical protein
MAVTFKSEYFVFLNIYGFKGPYEYQYGHWEGVFYVKGKIVLDFSFDGYWTASIMKTKKYYKDLEEGKIKWYSDGIKHHYRHNIKSLDKNSKNRVSPIFGKDHTKELNYYSKLIMVNIEILEGNFRKFSMIYPLLRLLQIN